MHTRQERRVNSLLLGWHGCLRDTAKVYSMKLRRRDRLVKIRGENGQAAAHTPTGDESKYGCHTAASKLHITHSSGHSQPAGRPPSPPTSAQPSPPALGCASARSPREGPKIGKQNLPAGQTSCWQGRQGGCGATPAPPSPCDPPHPPQGYSSSVAISSRVQALLTSC